VSALILTGRCHRASYSGAGNNYAQVPVLGISEEKSQPAVVRMWLYREKGFALPKALFSSKTRCWHIFEVLNIYTQ